MHPTARALFLLAALAAAPLHAQRPVQEYEPADRYSTFHLGAQLTGGEREGRDILLSWGRLRTAGETGEWMPRVEVTAGVTAAFDQSDDVVERALVGPQLSLGRAFPAQHLDVGRASRAEPYFVATVGAYGVADFVESGESVGVSPSVSGGVGFRVFGDEWDVDLGMLEFLVEKRFGFGAENPQLYIRFGRAVSPRAGRSARAGGPLTSTLALLPPPPPPFVPLH